MRMGWVARQWTRRVVFGVALATAGEKVLHAWILAHPDRTVDLVSD